MGCDQSLCWFLVRAGRLLSRRQEVPVRTRAQGHALRGFAVRLKRDESVVTICPASYISIPAMEADIRFAMVPANMARTPRRASSPFLFGASAPIPPI